MGDRDSRLVCDEAPDGDVAVVRTLRQPAAPRVVLARSPLKANIDAFKDAADHWRHDDILKVLLDLDTDDARRQALNMLSLSKLDALSGHLRRHPPPGARGIQVLYENDLTVEWTLSSRSDDPDRTRNNKPGSGRPATALSREHHDALVDKFPNWSVYPTR